MVSTCAVTRDIAAFVTGTRYEDLPAEAVETAKRCLIDGIGVLMAGLGEDCTKAALAYAESIQGVKEASVLGMKDVRLPASLAALVNGISGHALDWDDTALSHEADRSVLIHPTTQPMTAGLALAEALGGRSGRDLLTAFILGWEVECKIAESIHAEHFTGGRGFHTSGTIGVFGATVSASVMLGLSADQVTNALGLAASMASGIGVNHGTMGKPLQMGRAAENGVTAARLAGAGMTANPVALEGPRGFYHCFGGGFHPEQICDKVGRPFSILDPGVSVKPYPCGVVGHPGMDAMLELVKRYDLSPSQVASVKVATGSSVIPPKGPLRYKKADTALQGKFCLPFQLAAILIQRKAGLMEFTDAFVRRQDVQDMMDRIETVVDPEIAALGHDKLIFRIAVTMKDGAVFEGESGRVYRGGPLNPLTFEELTDKFQDASQRILDKNQAAKVIETLVSLDRQESLDPLIQQVTSPKG